MALWLLRQRIGENSTLSFQEVALKTPLLSCKINFSVEVVSQRNMHTTHRFLGLTGSLPWSGWQDDFLCPLSTLSWRCHWQHQHDGFLNIIFSWITALRTTVLLGFLCVFIFALPMSRCGARATHSLASCERFWKVLWWMTFQISCRNIITPGWHFQGTNTTPSWKPLPWRYQLLLLLLLSHFNHVPLCATP